MKPTQVEKETIILFNEGESTATIYTYNEKLKAQIAGYAENFPDRIGKYFLDDTGALHCELPKKDFFVRFKRPSTEKQRQAGRQNAARMLEKRGIVLDLV